MAHHHPPAILPRGTQALHLPPATVTAQGAPVLSGRWLAVGPVRRDHVDPNGGQLCVQRIAVVHLIPDQPFRKRRGKDLNESVWDKGDFMPRSSRRVDGERKTSMVCHRHELRTLAPLGRSHPWSPVFATTHVPSIQHVLRSSSPRSRRSAAKASRTCRSVPSRTHCWKRRWQVWYGGNRSGRSGHGAPLHRLHSMPLSTSRASRQGRPRPSPRHGGLGTRVE
jgi:hypothetical protein